MCLGIQAYLDLQNVCRHWYARGRVWHGRADSSRGEASMRRNGTSDSDLVHVYWEVLLLLDVGGVRSVALTACRRMAELASE